jgi:sialic acid synthase SpsE
LKTRIIAEIGWNFMGDMDLAEKMIIAAKDSGADIAKFQYWNPKKLKYGPWNEDGRVDIYKAAALTQNKIEILIKICNENKIQFLISAFNCSDASFLHNLGIKQLKIPSHEVANKKLHEFASKNFDKVFVSLGAGSTKEIEDACYIYNNNKSLPWVGMHCVSAYPCSDEYINLPRINFLKKYCKEVGFSDHTSDAISPALSVAFGVSTIEKHFTIDNELPGRDNKFALNPILFSEMVKNIRIAENSCIYHGPEAREIEKDTIVNYRGRWGD